MGILSDLFGQGRQRDAQQDTRLDDLTARLAALETGGVPAAPAGDGGELATRVETHRILLAELTGQASNIADTTTTLGQSINGLATTAQALHERLVAVEQEIADVRASVGAEPGEPTTPANGDDGAGVTLPEIK